MNLSEYKNKWSQLLSNNRQETSGKRSNSIDIRNPFERDIGRIVYSYPFRRMQDKTQVIPFPPIDFVHSRLTHSLEVATVGRSMGLIIEDFLLNKKIIENKAIGFIPAILYAASIAHDIGNPPFGHAGESSISKSLEKIIIKNKLSLSKTEYADLTNFEGNAFGFKLLTNPHNNSKMNITYATLGAFTKYPTNSANASKIETSVSRKKYGYFNTEAEIFVKIYQTLGLEKTDNKGNLYYQRHPLAYLVEAADDLCYLIMDFEDGVRLNLIDPDTGIRLLKPLASDYNTNTFNDLTSINEKIAYLRAMAIGFFTEETTKAFIKRHQDIINGSFDDYLINNISCSPEITETIREMRKLTMNSVYRSKPALYAEFNGDTIINSLISLFAEDIIKNTSHSHLVNLLPSEYHPEETDNDYAKLFKIACYIAGMTDSFAKKTYNKFFNL